MTDTTALKALLAHVEAGNWNPYANPLPSPLIDICRPYNGSLDAAKALHDAVLPGWHFDIATEANGIGFYCNLSPKAWGEAYIATACTPARAWLIAIIKAIMAQEAT